MKAKSLSLVRLFVTPWTAAHQAPPSMGVSRQSTRVGCHCLLRKGREYFVKKTTALEGLPMADSLEGKDED